MGESSRQGPSRPEADAARDVGVEARSIWSTVDEATALRGITAVGQLASLGTLAGGLVHEVNNPATFIALAGGQIEKSVAAAIASGSV